MTRTRMSMLAAAAVVVAIGGFAFALGGNGSEENDVSTQRDEPTDVDPSADATTTAPAEVATAFWQALAAGDRDATLASVDPTAIDSTSPIPFGTGKTLPSQLDWYQAVGWEWQLIECVEGSAMVARCTATATDTWSDALGVEPIEGTFIVRVNDAGIAEVMEEADSFTQQWSPQVFTPFARWVEENHPADAVIMFNFNLDASPEILDLFEVNTARFVEAQRTD